MIYWKLRNKCKKLMSMGNLYVFFIVNGTVRVKIIETHPVKPVTLQLIWGRFFQILILTICSFVFRDWFFELMLLIRWVNYLSRGNCKLLKLLSSHFYFFKQRFFFSLFFFRDEMSVVYWLALTALVTCVITQNYKCSF